MPKSRCVLILLAALMLFSASAWATDSPQFRGPERDGRFAAEGLLQSWPEDGPPKLWSASGLGRGYSSVSVVGDRIYTAGEKDGEGHVLALDTSGRLVWSRAYGAIHPGEGFPGTRATPTWNDGAIYYVSSKGQALAIDAASGEVRWQVDLLETYKGKNVTWGLTESPLVDAGNVIFTPGGAALLVALDKATGEEVWRTPGTGDTSAYCSPRLLDDGKRRQIVTMTQRHIVGVDAENGALLWQHSYPGEWDIHAVSPLFSGNTIYVSDGYKQGTAAFQLAEDGRSAWVKWKAKDLDVRTGGIVLVDGRLYGAASNGSWCAVDADSGRVVTENRGVGTGAVIYADGRLYGYLESGDVLLVDPESLEIVSQFKVTEGQDQHWAHPVVAGGVLYIRHGDVLMAFDVRAQLDGQPGPDSPPDEKSAMSEGDDASTGGT